MKKFILAIILLLTTSIGVHAMENTALSLPQQKLVEISALTAVGDLTQLKVSLVEGLDAGLSVNAIKEILIQLYAYCGFPRSLNAINTFIAVLEARQQQGIKDILGEEPAVLASTQNKYAVGKANYTTLFGSPDGKPKAAYEKFTPSIEVFLKEHLFADIFARGVLSFKERETATVAALAAMQGTSPQLQAHLQAALKMGLTVPEAQNLIDIIRHKIGKKEAKIAKQILQQIINN